MQKTAQKVVNTCLLLLGLLVVSILPLLLPLEFPFPATFIFSGSPYPCGTPTGYWPCEKAMRGSFQGTEHPWSARPGTILQWPLCTYWLSVSVN